MPIENYFNSKFNFRRSAAERSRATRTWLIRPAAYLNEKSEFLPNLINVHSVEVIRKEYINWFASRFESPERKAQIIINFSSRKYLYHRIKFQLVN